MRVEKFILAALWRSLSWTLKAVLAFLKSTLLVAGFLAEVGERIFEYTLGKIL
jgi:hypothetical protein